MMFYKHMSDCLWWVEVRVGILLEAYSRGTVGGQACLSCFQWRLCFVVRSLCFSARKEGTSRSHGVWRRVKLKLLKEVFEGCEREFGLLNQSSRVNLGVSTKLRSSLMVTHREITDIKVPNLKSFFHTLSS
jgi:hypothetical protein